MAYKKLVNQSGVDLTVTLITSNGSDRMLDRLVY